MLDFTRPIKLSAHRSLFIYPNRSDPDAYYAFSLPRLAIMTDGAPDITLMTYQKGGVITGGQLSLTTSLGLSEKEQRALQLALATPKSPSPSISSPDWSSGQVTVTIDDLLSLTGQPSLLAHNQCALSTNLTAQQAKAISQLWTSGNEWLSLSYRVEFTGWRSDEATHQATTQEPGCSSTQSFSVQHTSAQAITQSLTATLSPADGKRIEIKL